MIKSMTGYGQGRALKGGAMFTVQVQSVNRKYLEISVHLDKEFIELETPVRQRVNERIHRGRIHIFVKHEVPAEQHSKVVTNKRLAREYMQAFRSLQKEFHLKGELDIQTLLGARDVVQVLETHPDVQKSVPLLFKALDEALRRLDRMRVREGKNLARDFRMRLQRLSRELRSVRKQAPLTLKNYEGKWRKRMADLEAQGDSTRVDRDIAAFADKVDVSEELVRFQSHLEQFSEVLRSPEAKGKTMEFLVQEMVREANTIGSKANDLTVSRKIIGIKSELEKIREQVHNVE